MGPEENIAEFTAKAMIIGALIGAVFGAANAYLGLKVGLTVSASIPAAVMAVAIFKIMGRGTILETNMVQTIGSAGESLAAGVIFTVPAFFMGFESTKSELVLISILGGMLGVLFMIPLRRFLIVREHGEVALSWRELLVQKFWLQVRVKLVKLKFYLQVWVLVACISF